MRKKKLFTFDKHVCTEEEKKFVISNNGKKKSGIFNKLIERIRNNIKYMTRKRRYKNLLEFAHRNKKYAIIIKKKKQIVISQIHQIRVFCNNFKSRVVVLLRSVFVRKRFLSQSECHGGKCNYYQCERTCCL